MCLKSSVTAARFGLSDWLDTFETRIVECPTAIVNIIQALMVVTTIEGKSLAPFLESALFRLDANTIVPIWCALLLFAGVFQLLALVIGTARGTYALRLAAASLSAFVSLAVLLALFAGPQPWIVSIRYAIPFCTQAFCMGVLFVKHEDAKATDDATPPTSRASN